MSGLPDDDLTRALAVARPDDPDLLHLAVVGDTYTVLLSGEQTAGRFALIDMLIPAGRRAAAASARLRGVLPRPGRLGRGHAARRPAGAAARPGRRSTSRPTRRTRSATPPTSPRGCCAPPPRPGLETFFAEFGDRVDSRTSPPPASQRRGEAGAAAARGRARSGLRHGAAAPGDLQMKAVRFHEYGDAGVLRYEDAEQPVPGAGEVRIRVAATSFNPVDDGIRGGYLQGPFPVTLPHIPGIDVAGTVDALGEGVENVAVGDAVIALPADGRRRRGRGVRRRAGRDPGAGAHEHPARGRRRVADGRPHRVAGALRRRRADRRAARADQRRGRSGRRLRGAAGQAGRSARDRHGQPAQRRARRGRGRRRGHRPHHHRGRAVAEPVDVLLNLARDRP